MRGRPYILLAEDDDDLRVVLEEFLSTRGHLVASVEDGLELDDYLKAAQSDPRDEMPQLILCDVNMPGKTALEVLEAFSVSGACPILLMSALSNGEMRTRAERVGAEVVLDKPIDLEALGALVDSLIAARGTVGRAHAGRGGEAG